MTNRNKRTKADLLRELEVLQQRILELEKKSGSIAIPVQGESNENEQRYRTFMEAAFEGIAISENGILIDLNNQLAEMVGYDRNELLGKSVMNIIAPGSRPEAENAIRTNRLEPYELLGLRKDGTMFPVEVRARTARISDRQLRVTAARDITKRKETEAVLRASESKFSTAFRTMPDAININRMTDGLYLDINQGFTDMTGYTQEDVLGRTSLEIDIWVDPEDRARLTEGLRSRGMVNNFEANFRMKNGEVKAGLMSARIIEIEGQRCILSVTRDISDGKKMEQALRENEEQLRLITDNMVDTISQIDTERKFVYASPSLKRVFGYEPREIIGRHAFEFVHPDDIPAALEVLSETRRRGESSMLLKYRWRHADGRYLWVESATHLLNDKHGRPLGAIFGTRDITERKQAEDALARTSELLLALIDASPVAIDMVDNEGNVKLWSPAAERLFGWSSQEVLGHPLPFITEGKQYDLTEQIAQELEGMSVAGQETKRTRKDGSTVDVELWTAPMRNLEGRVIGSVGFITDITERKKAQQQIQALHSELLIAYDETLEGWSRALNLRDPNTDAHSKRVVEVTVNLAREVGIPDSELIHVRRGAILHDIGKMGIPDNVLLKTEPLTDEEWRIMRLHPVFAYEMLSKIPFLKPSLDIPYSHHERWDGSGYPRKLRATDIPLAARVFAVVDAFDALTSDRSYRRAWKKEDALSHIYAQAGIQFDPDIVQTFVRTMQ